MKVDAKRDGYLVLLDSYYPGWKAEVDGRAVPIERADYLFRAVFVTQGEHTVTFSYEPDSLKVGLLISIATAVLVAAGWFVLGVWWWMGRRGSVI